MTDTDPLALLNDTLERCIPITRAEFWATAKPIMQRWMDSRVGLRAMLKGTRDTVPYWLNRLPQFPHKVMELVDRLQDGRFQVELKSGEVDQLRKEIRRNNRNNIRMIVGCALVLAALAFYLVGPGAWMISGFPLLPVLLGVAGGWLIVKVLSEL